MIGLASTITGSTTIRLAQLLADHCKIIQDVSFADPFFPHCDSRFIGKSKELLFSRLPRKLISDGCHDEFFRRYRQPNNLFDFGKERIGNVHLRHDFDLLRRM